jgi:hypothetical protein
MFYAILQSVPRWHRLLLLSLHLRRYSSNMGYIEFPHFTFQLTLRELYYCSREEMLTWRINSSFSTPLIALIFF